ncbi:MAG: efflux transporter outer membrane subunit [Syntrophorhabdus sp.]|nr:efflux transporter outer membrane subunit [Syntrophorhabdus sp.]
MKTTITVCLALLIAGCAVVGPEVKPPSMETPATWKGQQTNTLIQSIPRDWWTIFGDETLNDLQRRAIGANQNLLEAIARVDENRANLRLAKADRYPSLNLNSSVERSRYSAHGSQGNIAAGDLAQLEEDYFRASLDAGYELDLWGRVKRSIQSAQARADAIEAARDTIMLNLTADLADNYFRLRSLDSEIEILQRALLLRKNALAVNQTRLDHGLALPADVSRAENEHANVQSDLSNARRRRGLYENALALLCGETASSFAIEPRSDSLAPPPKIPAGLPSQLLLRRPDIVEAERTAAGRCAEIGVAKAAFLPTIKLTGAAGLESIELRDLFTWDGRLWSIGPSVSLPIFSGGRNRANLKAAEARYKQAVAAYRQGVLAAFRDVENALVNIREYSVQESALLRAKGAAKRTSDYFRQRLHGGMIGYLDVVDAERTLLQAERSVVQNLASRNIATVQLIKALGGGWEGLAPQDQSPDNQVFD